MAYYAGEDDFYQDQPEFADDHMEERLVEAVGYHVQDSVNQALINALKPFAQPLRQRELRGRPLMEAGSQHDQLRDLAMSQGALKRPLSSADILANMAASVMQDHGYDVYSSLNTSEDSREASARPVGLSSSAQSFGSDQDQEDPKPTGKRKRKSHNTRERLEIKGVSSSLDLQIWVQLNSWNPEMAVFYRQEVVLFQERRLDAGSRVSSFGS
ncbi:hypothetical protein NDU88_002630 [Pleurodeles waltl]|uniref:Uncharacterized protein n=1 Tax=Pleurodeles waltl TaxID=8319 RepID=A0AAV7VEC9_PLEWA|nr:hypothetical protein NDU88_002630 [Pleurodeles waltl]